MTLGGLTVRGLLAVAVIGLFFCLTLRRTGTLWFAIGSTAFGIVVAAGLAWLVERTDVPGKIWIYAGVPMTLAMPGMLQAMAWATERRLWEAIATRRAGRPGGRPQLGPRPRAVGGDTRRRRLTGEQDASGSDGSHRSHGRVARRWRDGESGRPVAR